MRKDWLNHLDARVPRYTSYPTAPHFHAGIGGAEAVSWLSAADPAKPVSLYVHVPFCTKLCWYCGCNTEIVKTDAPVADYVDLLIAEISRSAALLPGRMRVSHLHLGGGSPNLLSPSAFNRLMDAIEARFDFLEHNERAIEIDPRGIDSARIYAYAARGFNRASIGVQDLDPAVQKAIHRVQPLSVVTRAVGLLREAGIASINFDLLYGLPNQTLSTVAATVASTLNLRPSRVALFGYAHVPWMKKYQKALERHVLPGMTERAALAETAREALELVYQPIGLDHFALAEDKLSVAARTGMLRRNFQGYTTDRAEALIAFGPSAISEFAEGYVQNTSDLKAWSALVSEGRSTAHRGIALTEDDRLRRAIIERLMCDLRVDLADIAGRFGADPAVFLGAIDRLRPFEIDGMVHLDGWTVAIPDEARVAMRSVAAVFDALLTAGQAWHAAAV